MIKLKRVYEPPSAGDGVRVLVDRVWPRGMTKEAVRVRQWMKELGPSDRLREFFGHDPARWEEFRKRYRAELRSAEMRRMLKELAEIAEKGTLTLVFGAKDETHNQAVVLREVLERMTRIGSQETNEPRRSEWN
ncbi:MAG TPA: DUF488 domain-containing protein [Candidatus Binataceae bacterium]|nr:DUF488 domain-containing protein [Candidatus Binataceae bacterium]